MRRARGTTMIELIVVGSMFLGLLTTLWMIYDSTWRVERNLSLKVDVDREVFAAVRHVDALVKTCRLVKPGEWSETAPPVDTIELKPLLVGADGQPMLNAKGFPDWGTAFTVSFAGGELVRVVDTERRRLARLGEDGRAQFRRPSQGMLEMDVKIEKVGFRDQKTSKELTFQFRLFNQ